MSKVHLPRMTFDRGVALCMACAGTISLLAGAGRLFNRPILASYNPSFIPMAPATALIFLGICGAWLFQRIFPASRWIRMLVLVALVGMIFFVIFLALRYFTGFGPDLEKILYPAQPMFGQFSSARMSPLSAVGFFLAILAFLLKTGARPSQHLRNISTVLSLALLIFSSLICLGYLYGAPPFYGGTLTPVAFTSALSFWFLSLGLLMTAGPSDWPTSVFFGPSLRARLMRTFIPAALLIVLLQGFLSTAAYPWVINPAIKVAVAAVVALLIVILLISLIANTLGSEIERGRKAEQALVKSETELRALFAGMMDVVIVMDVDGRYIEIAPTNPANLYRLPDEMLGKTLHEILPKEPADTILSMIQSSIQTGQVVFCEYALPIDGKEITFSASASRLSENTAIVVAHDITIRKRVEQALHENEEKFHDLFNNAEVGMFRTRLDGTEILDMNEKFLTIFGRTRAEMQGSASVLLWADPHQREEMVRRLETEDQLKDFECGMLNKQGQLRTCLVSLRLYREKGILDGSILDITERKQFELVQNAIYRISQATLTSEGMDELYRSIHSILGELIPAENFFIGLYDPVNGLINFPYYIDQYDEAPSPIPHTQGLSGYLLRKGRPLLVTREIYNRLVGEGEVEPVGTAFVDWMGAPLKTAGRTIGVMAVQNYKKGIRFEQKDLNLLEFVSTQVAQAIERKRMEEEIRSLSLTDELTGLYNRRGFTLLAEHEVKLARREKRDMLLLFGDVDDLKAINDTYGHAQGDLTLQEISVLLKNSFREADILARFGGDEFVALAVDAALENANILSTRIQVALQAHNLKADRTYTLSLSTGMVCYDPETACTISEMIAQADAQMYAQKQARKGKMELPGALT
ncbi:MAG: diguanylate cyclase [Anaerolineales bacterium]|jgi:diguanylate cyclase (GGDEF)-like protein/PAS domain S-box-containing protein